MMLLAGMQRNASPPAALMTDDSCLFDPAIQVLFKADAEYSQYGRGPGEESDAGVQILDPGHSLGARIAQDSCSSFRIALNN